MILRLARKTSEAQFFSLILTDSMYQVFRFWDGWSRWSTYSNNLSPKKHAWFVIFLQMFFPWTAIWNFHISHVFLHKNKEMIGRRLEQNLRGLCSTINGIGMSRPRRVGRLSRCKSLKICSLFQRFFCKICVLFWGSLEIQKKQTQVTSPCLKA